MVLRKKILLNIIILFFIFLLVIPLFSFAFNQEDIYVWSNFSSPTSITPTEEETNNNTLETR